MFIYFISAVLLLRIYSTNIFILEYKDVCNKMLFYSIAYNRNNVGTIYLTIDMSLLNNFRCLYTLEYYIATKTKVVYIYY